MVAASKVPMLKPGEFEIWGMMIEQYIQMIDYALWEVIKNDATLQKTQVVKGVTKEVPITTAEEKAQRRLEGKDRSSLMMGIPNEHQLKFNSIKDAKQLLEAVEKRFGWNATTKKTQKNLLKQQYENFIASSSEMNKADLNTMSMDDTYNNLKVTNGAVYTAQAVNTANRVSTASTQVNAAYSTNIDNLSDAAICLFFASQPNSPKLVHEDLEQIHRDDMEEMDLRWQIVMLTMRARKFLKKNRRKLIVNGNETLRNQDNKHKESSRRSIPMEISTSLVSCDGLGGYDWSDQAHEGPNYALMAFSSSSSESKVSSNSTCSKSYLETIKLLKSQNKQLLKDLKKSKLMVLGYKTSLKSVEERLEFFKTNESIYLEDIKVLKVEIQMKEIAIRELRKKLEIAQKEKDGIQLTVDKFKNASKSLNKLIECQIVNNCKKSLSCENYNAVLPSYTRNFMPPTPNLSFTGLDKFVNKPVVKNCKAKSSEEEPKVVRKNDDATIIEEWVLDNKEEDASQPKVEKKTVKPSIAKIEFVKPKQQKKTASKTIKQIEQHRQNTRRPRDN
uniref:Ribonuclease H-like domain-containing protein n=1 Tax=Tanacetum cinerariifolium TaxID=118510 RepID=A0A6L2LGP2_TANCI|nr:ribonuclease H-like domain-containing protein [Tanacetum cinerariifolium]